MYQVHKESKKSIILGLAIPLLKKHKEINIDGIKPYILYGRYNTIL